MQSISIKSALVYLGLISLGSYVLYADLLPPGSYLQTCTNCTYKTNVPTVNNQLICRCKKKDGSINKTAILSNLQPGGTVINIDTPYG